jgi:hypothetical protein
MRQNYAVKCEWVICNLRSNIFHEKDIFLSLWGPSPHTIRTPTEFVLVNKLPLTSSTFVPIFPSVFALETCSNEERAMELKKEYSIVPTTLAKGLNKQLLVFL